MLRDAEKMVCVGGRELRWFKPWKFLPANYIDDIESKLKINQGSRDRGKKEQQSQTTTQTQTTSVANQQTTHSRPKKDLE